MQDNGQRSAEGPAPEEEPRPQVAAGAGTGPVLVTGASGRIGAILRRFWPGHLPAPLWQHRGPPGSRPGWLDWDMRMPYRGPAPAVILNLAGVTAPPDVEDNIALAEAALDAGRATGARVILVSSAAVYGRAGGLLGEDRPLAPLSPYGRAKAEMEARAAGRGACILRLGNVAGADALLGGLVPGHPPVLDRFADGRMPRRSYIGPATLARVLAALAARADLPEILNVAEPGAVGMADLLAAAGIAPDLRDAPATAIASVELDVSRLCALVPLAPADPRRMVAEWRALGQG